jgi:hypothetical protein
MRFYAIAFVAISMSVGCASELVQRAPAMDPTSVGSAEAPYHAPPSWRPDPLLADVSAVAPARRYACPMHPDVHADAEGTCLRCGMILVPVPASSP